MAKHEMFGNFDPYELIIAMDLKLGQLVDAHNNLAVQFEQHKKDFDVLLKSHQVNQQSIVQLTHNNNELLKAVQDCLNHINNHP
jgi:hypothetical protein